MIGQRFGLLTVIEIGPTASDRRSQSLCLCDCGARKMIKNINLKRGNTRSCGCLSKKHGMSGTREYRCWAGMIQRCHNHNNPDYAEYGGRGISVCQEWRDSFSEFIDHMGSAPSPIHSLDRIDIDGNYEPGNVRWSTPREQSINKRNNRIITFNGKTMLLEDWSKETGLSGQTIWHRISRGWPVERALTTPSLRHG
jgi:hypothetical protein